MRFKLRIDNPDISWDDFKVLISRNIDSDTLLNACYNKSKKKVRTSRKK